MAQLQAEAKYKQLLQDKDFMAAPRGKKLQYLREVFIPAIDPDFKRAPVEKQEAYLSQVVMPKIEQPPPLNAISKTPVETTPQKPPSNLTGHIQKTDILPGKRYTHPWKKAQEEAATRETQMWMKNHPIGLEGATAIGAFDPGKAYSLPERIGHVAAGALGGVLKGVIPIEEIDNPVDPSNPLDSYYKMDPWGRTAETGTRAPVSIAANILGAVFTRGLYNAAYAGISAKETSRMAYEQALRSGQYDAARNIKNAEFPSVLANTAYGFGVAKIPAFIGKTPVTKIGTGLAMGYPQDIADRLLMQYAETGKVDPSKVDYTPGLNTLIGGSIPAGQHYLPKVAKSLGGRPLTAAQMKALLAKSAKKIKGGPETPIALTQVRKEVTPVQQGKEVTSLGVEETDQALGPLPEPDTQNAPHGQKEVTNQGTEPEPSEGLGWGKEDTTSAKDSMQQLNEQVSFFKNPKDPMEAKKAAMEIERLAKEVSKEEFEAVMKRLSQDELDKLGREYGC